MVLRQRLFIEIMWVTPIWYTPRFVLKIIKYDIIFIFCFVFVNKNLWKNFIRKCSDVNRNYSSIFVSTTFCCSKSCFWSRLAGWTKTKKVSLYLFKICPRSLSLQTQTKSAITSLLPRTKHDLLISFCSVSKLL